MANGYLSDAFADIVLAAVFTNTPLPTSYWVGLTLALPTDGEGTGLVVPDAAEYARVEIGNSWLSMGAGSRSIESSVDVEFAVLVTDWGTVVGYTLYDAATDGNYLGFGITNPYILLAGMKPRLSAGSIVISLPIGS